MSFSVFMVAEPDILRAALRETGAHDFVHTYDFHKLSQLNGEGDPLMFVVRSVSGEVHACWPLLCRNIPGTALRDLTSVYGYAGPVFSNGSNPDECIDLIIGKMKEEGFVSLFSRMHPLFINEFNLEASKGMRLGDVVVLQIEAAENVLLKYRGSHRREILAARKKGLEVVVDDAGNTLENFVSIYQAAMADLDASDYYHFDKLYFERLFLSEDFKVVIISAVLDSEFIASSLFIITGSVMQYYLSGTVADHRNISPSKAIIAKAHELAILCGCKYLVLGGGVGSKIDALFKFKQGFSDYYLPFYVKKLIINEKQYSGLVCAVGYENSQSSFFPLYRLNLSGM